MQVVEVGSPVVVHANEALVEVVPSAGVLESVTVGGETVGGGGVGAVASLRTVKPYVAVVY